MNPKKTHGSASKRAANPVLVQEQKVGRLAEATLPKGSGRDSEGQEHVAPQRTWGRARGQMAWGLQDSLRK